MTSVVGSALEKMSPSTSSSNAVNAHRPLSGKIALVTGSSRGIGRGIAIRLAERGATVVVNYVADEASATATLEKIRDSGSDGIVVRADVSRPDELTRLVEQVGSSFGALDL